MSLLDKLRGFLSRRLPIWIPASENRYGIEILDVRSSTQGVTAWTRDKSISESFVKTRSSSGQHHRETDPSGWKALECELSYSYEADTPEDGPVFKASDMEEKWDIYLYDSQLFFARSWTDRVVYVASLDFRNAQVVIDSIRRSPSIEEDPDLSRKTVDFLLKSHLYDAVVPHPIPREAAGSSKAIGTYSFSTFGRRAWFASRGDTISVRLGPGIPKIGSEPD